MVTPIVTCPRASFEQSKCQQTKEYPQLYHTLHRGTLKRTQHSVKKESVRSHHSNQSACKDYNTDYKCRHPNRLIISVPHSTKENSHILNLISENKFSERGHLLLQASKDLLGTEELPLQLCQLQGKFNMLQKVLCILRIASFIFYFCQSIYIEVNTDQVFPRLDVELRFCLI